MPDESISKSELGNRLLGACDILRGPINQDEYKSYVTPLLFFKRISDVYDEETAEALEASGGDEDFAALPENHSFEVPEGCHWQDVRNTGANVGKAIVDAMVGIERANPDTLSGLFSSFDDASWTDKGKLTDERLKDLVEHFSAKRLGNRNYSADMMGDAYEYLIKKFADMQKKNAGEFYTPREIVKMMVALLGPKPGESVYDPACGTGGMLIEAVRQMDNSKLTYGKLFGQEKNLSTSAIARMNLYLHGAKDFRVAQGGHPARAGLPRRQQAQDLRLRPRQPALLPQELGLRRILVRPVGPQPLGRPHGQVRRLRLGAAHGLLHGRKERQVRGGVAAGRPVPRR